MAVSLATKTPLVTVLRSATETHLSTVYIRHLLPQYFLKMVSHLRYDEWFWGNIAKLGYTREDLQGYRGHGFDGSIQLFMREGPDGKPEPDKIKIYCGKTVVFDSSNADKK